MRSISSFVISFLLLNILAGQHIGIGSSDPQTTLHAAGKTRTDDLLDKIITGSSILGELIPMHLRYFQNCILKNIM